MWCPIGFKLIKEERASGKTLECVHHSNKDTSHSFIISSSTETPATNKVTESQLTIGLSKEQLLAPDVSGISNTLLQRFPVASAKNYPGVIDHVRKWSIKYDGGRDPMEFIERIDKLSDAYGLNRNLLPKIWKTKYAKEGVTRNSRTMSLTSKIYESVAVLETTETRNYLSKLLRRSPNLH